MHLPLTLTKAESFPDILLFMCCYTYNGGRSWLGGILNRWSCIYILTIASSFAIIFNPWIESLLKATLGAFMTKLLEITNFFVQVAYSLLKARRHRTCSF